VHQRLKALIPPSLNLPLRYYQLRLLGRFDSSFSFIPKYIKNRERAIDVGANAGFYSYFLSRLCRHVEAFEPVPDAGWLRSYGRNIRFHQVALSNRTGEAVMEVPVRSDGFVLGGYASLKQHALAELDGVTYKSITAPMRRLDDYEFSDVGFIKIDVEGHELEVLEGAEATLGVCRPSLFVEIEQRHLTRDMGDVFVFLRDLGYRGALYLRGERHDLSEFSYAKHQAPFLDNVFIDGYVNNFLFTHG